MEAAYLSAMAVLAGSTLGGLTSIATSWLSQHVQFRTRLQAADLRKREELYSAFIEEASRTYAHALQHEDAGASTLVDLYALISRMRINASPEVVESAEAVVEDILDAYLAPNRTLHDVREHLGDSAVDPLRHFAHACRAELRMLPGVESVGRGGGFTRVARGAKPIEPATTRRRTDRPRASSCSP